MQDKKVLYTGVINVISMSSFAGPLWTSSHEPEMKLPELPPLTRHPAGHLCPRQLGINRIKY